MKKYILAFFDIVIIIVWIMFAIAVASVAMTYLKQISGNPEIPAFNCAAKSQTYLQLLQGCPIINAVFYVIRYAIFFIPEKKEEK